MRLVSQSQSLAPILASALSLTFHFRSTGYVLLAPPSSMTSMGPLVPTSTVIALVLATVIACPDFRRGLLPDSDLVLLQSNLNVVTFTATMILLRHTKDHNTMF